MRLGEVMTRDVEVVGSNAPLMEAATKMKDLDVGLIPVCDGDELQGTLTDRDITVRAKQIRRLAILSREKRLVGIVSLGDLAVHAGKNELLGEILKEVSRPAVPRRVNIKVIAVPDCENNDDYAESSRRPSR